MNEINDWWGWYGNGGQEDGGKEDQRGVEETSATIGPETEHYVGGFERHVEAVTKAVEEDDGPFELADTSGEEDKHENCQDKCCGGGFNNVRRKRIRTRRDWTKVDMK